MKPMSSSNNNNRFRNSIAAAAALGILALPLLHRDETQATQASIPAAAPVIAVAQNAPAGLVSASAIAPATSLIVSAEVADYERMPAMDNPRASTSDSDRLRRYALRIDSAEDAAVIRDAAQRSNGRIIREDDNMMVAYISAAEYAELEARDTIEGFEDDIVRSSFVSANRHKHSHTHSHHAAQEQISNTANLPATAQTAVAVLDTGVENRSDINLVASYDIVPRAAALEVADGFERTDWLGDDGITTWSGTWYEWADDGIATTGAVRTVVAQGEGVMRIDGNGAYHGNDRPVDLSQANSAMLSFDWKPADPANAQSASLFVEVFTPNTGWVSVKQIARSEHPQSAQHSQDYWRTESVDLSGYISSDTWISITTSDSEGYSTLVDNVSVQYSLLNQQIEDGFGHGTHIAGTIGTNLTTKKNEYLGVAPNTPIVSVRVLDSHGNGYASDVIAGLNLVRQIAGQHNVRVANLSLGTAVSESVQTDPLVHAAEAVWDAGIAVVVSAGNFGEYGNFTVTSPGNSPKVITVGAFDYKNLKQSGAG